MNDPLLVSFFRVPIIVLTTFKKNKDNAAITKSEKRTGRQRKEIHYALEAREERLKSKRENNTI